MKHKNNKQKSNLKPNLKKMLKSMKKYYLPIIISSIFTIVSVVLSILAPQYLSKLTDTITAGAGTQNINLQKICDLGIVLIVFYSLNAFFSFLSGAIMNTATQKYSKDLRNQITQKINRIKLKYFDSHQFGDTLSRITNDVDTIGSSLQESVSMLIQSVFMLIGVIIAMFVTSPLMTLTILASLPLMFGMFIIIAKLAVPMFKKHQTEVGEINSVVEENFSIELLIKVFSTPALEKRQQIFDTTNNKLKKTMFKAQFFGGLIQPMMSFVSYFAYTAVCLVGGLLMTSSGIVTFGTITAFLVYVNLFQSPLSQIAQAFNNLQMAAAASERVFEFLEEDEVLDETNKPYLILKDNNQIKGKVEFKNVSFGYDKNRIIIPNFSITVQPGMKVAIVGPTGAGKTTIVNLLMRFYETNSGDILIDDVSIKDMPRSEVRDIFSMVLQDTWIFEGTLRDNIIYNNKNVTEDELDFVIDEANLTHFVSTLSNGKDTIIKEDDAISAGQRQLITIARAILKNSPLLILDEATSNVDTKTEILLQQAMDNLTKNRTSFVIAHRLSTIRNSDLILVLKDGNIIESGTHEKLLSQNGCYTELYNSQFDEEEE